MSGTGWSVTYINKHGEFRRFDYSDDVWRDSWKSAYRHACAVGDCKLGTNIHLTRTGLG